MRLYYRVGRLKYTSKELKSPYSIYYAGTYYVLFPENDPMQWIYRIMGMKIWQEKDLIYLIDHERKINPAFNRAFGIRSTKRLIRRMAKLDMIGSAFSVEDAILSLSFEPAIRTGLYEEDYIGRSDAPEYALSRARGSEVFGYDVNNLTTSETCVYEEIQKLYKEAHRTKERPSEYQGCPITVERLMEIERLSPISKDGMIKTILSLINRGSLCLLEKEPRFAKERWASIETMPFRAFLPKGESLSFLKLPKGGLSLHPKENCHA